MIKVGDCREYNDERERELPSTFYVEPFAIIEIELMEASINSISIIVSVLFREMLHLVQVLQWL